MSKTVYDRELGRDIRPNATVPSPCQHSHEQNCYWCARAAFMEAELALADARKALEEVIVFKIEGDYDTYVSICGVRLMAVKAGTPAERALLKFDAAQRAVLQDIPK